MEMIFACEKGHLDDVTVFLEGGIDVNKPFYELCLNCFDITGQPLEDPPEDPFEMYAGPCPCYYNGDTYLRFAAENGQTEVVKTLVGWGAVQDVKDINGDTPLLLAAGEGHIDTVKELLVLGSNWKCTNNQSKNVLDILSIFGGEESRQEIEHFIVEINECNLKPAKKSD